MEAALPSAVILAGGLGTRIRAIAGSTPKTLLPIGGRPFLGHLLEYLHGQGVTRVVLCLGHGADQVWDAAGTDTPPGMTLIDSREKKPLGTAGAVRQALPHLGKQFFLINGDTFLDASLPALLELHLKQNAALTLSLVRAESAGEKGSVRIAPDGKVLAFEEKTDQGSGLINGGVYMVEARVFGTIPENVFCSLEREIIPGLLNESSTPVFGRVVEAPFVDIGLPEDYLRVREQLPRAGER